MKNKILIFASLVLILSVGFYYINQNYLSANEKDGKSECNHSCSQQKTGNKEIKAGGEYSTYEFITDKACCDEMKTSMQTELMNINGVKEVKFGPSCSASKMTNVSIYYSSDETNEATIASYVKDKEFTCPDGTNCPEGKCNHKSSKNTKNI